MRRSIQVLMAAALFSVLLAGNAAGQTSRRDRRVQPEKIMDFIGVAEGMVIGEAGAGEGYLTFKLSPRVGTTGKIYANDISRRVLQSIEDRCNREEIANIETVLGMIDDPSFPVDTLDMVVMIHAFHDFTEKVPWLKNTKKYMKPGATLVIIDGHDSHTQFNKEKVVQYGEDAGLKLVKYNDSISSEYIYIFKKR